MVKDFAIKGLLLGIVAGLLVTLIEGCFMLIPNSYVPYSYPWVLASFNVLFWITVGLLSGFFLQLYLGNRGELQGDENFYWALFFLVPFALIFGIGGRIYIPLKPGKDVPPFPAFDHQLSFIWAALFLVFLLFYFKRSKTAKKTFSVSFIPEILVIILLFHFCSNLLRVSSLWKFYFKNPNIVYIAGVLLIFIFYFSTFYITRRLKKRDSFRKNYLTILILFIIVIICLAGFYKWNHANLDREEYPGRAFDRNLKAGKISHVLLIVLDTVRADRLPMYGNEKTTKNLEEFSQGALVFKNCIASSSWTLPSHASLFTGLYPSEHGVYKGGMLKQKGLKDSPAPLYLSDKFITLAEKFRDSGYRTCAVVSNFGFLSPELNVNQGFQSYDNRRNISINLYPFRPLLNIFCFLTNIRPEYILPARTADAINNEVFRLLDKLNSSPFFLFINYMDAHGPNLPPRPFDGYFSDKPFPQLQRLKQYFLFLRNKVRNKSWNSYMLSQYDGEIAFLDDQLGRLFSRLKKMGLYESSLIIITSDHGELFGKHGYGHVGPLYEGRVKVPLLVKFPYAEKVGQDKRMITLADLYSTILSICGLPIPDGISGKAFGDASSPGVSEFYDKAFGEHRNLYDGKYKYMRYQYTKGHELYDLEKDPMEMENLAQKMPAVTLEMEEKLKDWEKAHGPKYTLSKGKENLLPRETLEALKALGYVE